MALYLNLALAPPDPYPGHKKLIRAALIAPLAPIALCAALFWLILPAIVLVGIFVGYQICLFVFTPIYLFFRQYIRIPSIGAAALGFVCAALADAVTTYYSVTEPRSYVPFAVLGAIGGLCFWYVFESEYDGQRDAGVVTRNKYKALLLCFPALWLLWSNDRAAGNRPDGILELHERNGVTSAHPIILDLPEAYHRSWRQPSEKRYKAFKTSIFLTYPGLAEARRGAQNGRDAFWLDIANVANQRQQWPRESYGDLALRAGRGGIAAEIEPRYGFDQILQSETTTYYIKNGADTGKVDFVAICTPSAIDGCQLSFVLACNANIGIRTEFFPHDRINEWQDARRRIDSLVSSMVRPPDCAAAM